MITFEFVKQLAESKGLIFERTDPPRRMGDEVYRYEIFDNAQGTSAPCMNLNEAYAEVFGWEVSPDGDTTLVPVEADNPTVAVA